MSLLVTNGLSPFVDRSEEGADEKYTELAILLALMVGLLECAMGLARYFVISYFFSSCNLRFLQL